MATQTQTALASHSFINTTFPVLLPDTPELRLPKSEFHAYINALVAPAESKNAFTTSIPIRSAAGNTEQTDETSAEPAKTAAHQGHVESDKGSDTGSKDAEIRGVSGIPDLDTTAPFMDALLSDKATVPTLDECDGKMLTENADVAYRTSGAALVDLFHELEDVVSGKRMRQTLEAAWKADPEATLKIIWNARSIHLGKSSRNTFYRAVGWLAENHPATFLTNLPWLVRPIIQKKVPKPDEKKEGAKEDGETEETVMVDDKDVDSDFEIVDEGEKTGLDGPPSPKKIKLDEEAMLSEYDVKYGVAHGYWKDLLNILALAVNEELKVDGNPRSVLNVEKPTEKKYKRDWTQGLKKIQTAERHERAVNKLGSDNLYKALHLSVARLFADQLKSDLVRLNSGSKADMKRISLAAKWAPSNKGVHDQHTCIVSTIAELINPFESVCPAGTDPADRTLYLKYARETYQSHTLSPLRKFLQIVERPITAEKFGEIQYDRVPSIAMKQYTGLFIRKDQERFEKYIDAVAQGKVRISGATLLPSTLVAAVSDRPYSGMGGRGAKGANAMVEAKKAQIEHGLLHKTLDGQWKTLVQRIKDSGTLESSIAVCDVSGSMSGPRFADGTCPMDSAIGLSLLLAQVTKPPFGGAFITFSADPQVMNVGGTDGKTFAERVEYIKQSNWSMNTDFVAVFERLILPMAIQHKLKQEDIVKQVFVFSDMQFDNAQGGFYNYGSQRHDTSDRWSTSYERIQKKFKDAGYEMPKLIFWNLAGGRAGYGASPTGGDETAPKPVQAFEEGTALVSGYSQGQMKMFLDNGQFKDPEDEIVEEEGEDGEVVIKKEQPKMDPMRAVRKAISHEAYRMLRAVD